MSVRGFTTLNLHKPLLRGPMTMKVSSGSAGQFAGRVAVGSGDTSATVSTNIVGAESIILHTYQSAFPDNSAQNIFVNTISPGNFFTFTISPALVETDFDIHWVLFCSAGS